MYSEKNIEPHITTSREGKPCIGMREDGHDWILLSAKRTPLAEKLAEKLLRQFEIQTQKGPQFNWRESLKMGELVTHPEENVTGLYVRAEEFDDILTIHFFSSL